MQQKETMYSKNTAVQCLLFIMLSSQSLNTQSQQYSLNDFEDQLTVSFFKKNVLYFTDIYAFLWTKPIFETMNILL